MRREGLLAERAPAKLNLALHVRGDLPDRRRRIETLFVFCEDGDELSGEESEDIELTVEGREAPELSSAENLVVRAAYALRQASGVEKGARLFLRKRLPLASGLGGGSADAAAALRLLVRLWKIEPSLAGEVAPKIGSDVPACLISQTSLGTGAGDQLTVVHLPELARKPVLLVNPSIKLGTAEVFGRWDGVDRGPLKDWRNGRNDLEAPAISLVPEIGDVLDWLGRTGAEFVRMSGSGATCFA
ncbi:MAG TPA: 4-(cytidine 5'-diphospho)-2-C-methyl-D-erythritol kinase, partial [Sphingomicrobium sp.]|nr:4-(cytidine 5'-diphospho)-2-C-methyl-D-erythritol kinase [Sphingomicrobium sp.]